MLDSLTPGQKQMLMAGVPVVAVFALVAGRKQKAAPTTTAPVAMPTNAVLGADALNSFMDQISQSIGGLQAQIDGMGAVDTVAPPPPPTPTAAPAVTDSTPTPPTAVNQYHVGQVVNAAGGESIVAAGFDPRFGWLDLTSKGGVYSGGGGGDQIPGSYLGYVASLPADQQAAELALHGTFGSGGLQIDPATGAYVETNTKGETYRFG